MNRRNFLELTASMPLLALAPTISWAAAPAGADYQRLLVLIELKGGNDGLNTLVPYANSTYYALRPKLAVPRDQVVQLSDRVGLHPALAPLLPFWTRRELAVLQGVGYPDPNLSHFRSIEIWDTASRSDQYLADGWLARLFAERPVPDSYAADGVVVGSNDMGPLAGQGGRAIALADPEQFLRQARLANREGKARNAALAHILKVENDIIQAASHLSANRTFNTEFPRNPFGNAVRTAAQLAANPAGVAVICLSLGGFDTHQNQLGVQPRLLGELAEGIAALKSALVEAGRWDSTLLMTYSEFGRRPQENNSNGTDHGTASAHFVAGGKVRGGLYGDQPRLDALEGGNLRYAVDFRSLFATATQRWWSIESSRALGGRFDALDLIRAA